MSTIPVKKLKESSGSVSTTNGDSFYPLSVADSVLINYPITIQNKTCGSYEIGSVVGGNNTPVKLSQFLSNITALPRYQFLDSSNLNISNQELLDDDTKVPTSALVKSNVDSLSSRITTYLAGSGLSATTPQGGSSTLNHTNSVSEKSSFQLRRFKYDSCGHITDSTEIDLSSLSPIDTSGTPTILAVATAYNNLLSLLKGESS